MYQQTVATLLEKTQILLYAKKLPHAEISTDRCAKNTRRALGSDARLVQALVRQAWTV